VLDLAVQLGADQEDHARNHRCDRLELAHEGDQVGLFLGAQLEAENQVEELQRVLEGEQPAVVEIRCQRSSNNPHLWSLKSPHPSF
jgi:hypothetical protein